MAARGGGGKLRVAHPGNWRSGQQPLAHLPQGARRTKRSMPSFLAILAVVVLTAVYYQWMPFVIFLTYLLYGFLLRRPNSMVCN